VFARFEIRSGMASHSGASVGGAFRASFHVQPLHLLVEALVVG
jgi:hypothetical protein